ncbi:MAG: galactose mutarotase [Clostridia bacterium]|nr:galactose mutarotase [Clostridia bacterium]
MELFGKIKGCEVYSHTLCNSKLKVNILSYGAIIQSLVFNGVDVVLGYNTLDEYVLDDMYLGAVIGRVSNVIDGAKFTLNGTTYNLDKNDGDKCSHGGYNGFNKKVFEVESYSKTHITLKCFSADGEGGFPANVTAFITYEIKGASLIINYKAIADGDTPLSLTNHAYFNLNGEGKSLEKTYLKVNANSYTVTSPSLVPTGEIKSVLETPLDYSSFKSIDCLDVNFCVSGNGFREVATAKSTLTNICVTAYSDKEGLQVYTANELTARKGKTALYTPFSAFCLETQGYPNAVNEPNFKSVILKKNTEYNSTTEYKFSLI